MYSSVSSNNGELLQWAKRTHYYLLMLYCQLITQRCSQFTIKS